MPEDQDLGPPHGTVQVALLAGAERLSAPDCHGAYPECRVVSFLCLHGRAEAVVLRLLEGLYFNKVTKGKDAIRTSLTALASSHSTRSLPSSSACACPIVEHLRALVSTLLKFSFIPVTSVMTAWLVGSLTWQRHRMSLSAC